MSKFRLFIIVALEICLLLVFHGQIKAQVIVANSFHKGALLLSLSEGTTHTIYSTTNNNIVTNNNNGNGVTNDGHPTHINGDRDPLTLEYGLTDRLGIGFNLGTDIIKVNPEKFYGFKTAKNTANAFMSEVTIDVNYHFFNTKHTDFSGFVSIGGSGVTIKGDDAATNDGQRTYQYNATGGIVRVGSKVKYYFRKRFGVMAMASAYSANCSTKGVEGNTAGNGISTSIKGWALEFGPCFRFF